MAQTLIDIFLEELQKDLKEREAKYEYLPGTGRCLKL